MYSVVLDTNVLISAVLFPGSAPSAVYELARRGFVKLYLSDFIFSEVERVLRVKFELSPRAVSFHIRLVRTMSIEVFPRKHTRRIRECPDDNYILDCALEAKADYLVTGDKKHILPLGKVGNTRIISPAEFLELYKQ